MTKYPFAPRVNPDGTAKPETDEEFHERVVACLERLDSMDRLERAERHIWMGKKHVRVDGGYWERSETSSVMQEARSSYIHGNFIATLVLALAYIVQAWQRAWEYVIPFFVFPPEIRRVIYTTNAIESLNMQLRKIIKTRGHFPNDEAAIKLMWLALRNVLNKSVRAAFDWKSAMNQFAIMFGERFTQARG